MAVVVNGSATADWPGRYFHIDQILDKPGPRTDPGFAAGAEVGFDFVCFSCWKKAYFCCVLSLCPCRGDDDVLIGESVPSGSG